MPSTNSSIFISDNSTILNKRKIFGGPDLTVKKNYLPSPHGLMPKSGGNESLEQTACET